MQKRQRVINIIAYSAIALALNLILSYLKFGSLPQGGSITVASMLPLFLLFFMVGFPWSLILGFTAGILQFIIDGMVIHWGSIFFDYLIPFTLLGLCSLFRHKKLKNSRFPYEFIIGIIVCTVLRYFSHVFSGVLFFEEYAGGQNVWAYSLGYNTFVFVDMAICLAITIPLCLTRQFRTLLLNKI